ncbi:hypothetical protein EZV73_09085 [Acidaminobacter sp. JC074]|uniref:hypothetical protein n=1 Tax=Acidaminobacter sp. JC074 TaxID=2530199 RepID=UPI001F0FEF30|nr:hypothetical protein [Acidaminobacter sp. JC074]MCH4887726.1 hypothetical protein [Acidaminobacter sp. JC074]
MKKILIVVMIFLLVGCSGDSSRNYNEMSLDMMNLKGQVESFVQTGYNDAGEITSFDFIDMGYYMNSLASFEYDKKGNLTAQTDRSTEGDTIVTWMYSYDNKNMMNVFAIDFDENISKMDYEQIFKTEEMENNTVKGVMYGVAGEERTPLTVHDRIYDKDKLIETKDFNLEAYMVYGVTYAYTDAGYILETVASEEVGVLDQMTMTYNEDNQLLSYTHLNANFESKANFEYVAFDEKGNWTEATVTIDDLTYKLTRTYSYY